MTEMVETTEDRSMRIDRLKPLVHYFKALVKSYPNPITQKELATKVHMTKSAVNKVKDRLFDLCDKDVLAYRSKMVLSADIGTFLKLIVLFVYTEGGYSVHEILESNYGEKMIHNTYGSLSTSEGLERLEDFVSEDEFQQIIEIIAPNLDYLGSLDLLISKLDDLDEELIIQAAVVNILQQMGNEFRLWTRDEEDIILLQKLKARFITDLEEFLKKNIEKMEIITNLRSDEERKIYQEVYSQTISHYLPKVFDMFAEQVIKQEQLPYVEDMS